MRRRQVHEQTIGPKNQRNIPKNNVNRILHNVTKVDPKPSLPHQSTRTQTNSDPNQLGPKPTRTQIENCVCSSGVCGLLFLLFSLFPCFKPCLFPNYDARGRGASTMTIKQIDKIIILSKYKIRVYHVIVIVYQFGYNTLDTSPLNE